jgi:hypothetical protein
MAETVQEQIEYGNRCTPHGNPVGTPGGADIMCHECEMGLTKWVDNPTFMLQMRLLSHGPPLHYQSHWIGLGEHLTIQRSRMNKANRQLVKIHRYLTIFGGHDQLAGIFEWRMHQVRDGYWDEA